MNDQLIRNLLIVIAYFQDEPLYQRAALLHLCACPETRWLDWTFVEHVGDHQVCAVDVLPSDEKVWCN